MNTLNSNIKKILSAFFFFAVASPLVAQTASDHEIKKM